MSGEDTGACLTAPGSIGCADEAPLGLRPSGNDPSRELYRALEDFDNWFAGFDPEDRASRMAGRLVVIRTRELLSKHRELAA